MSPIPNTAFSCPGHLSATCRRLALQAALLGTILVAAPAQQSTCVVWGFNQNGEASVPALPVGLSYTSVSAGRTHCAAVRSNGTAVAWGDNSYGQCNLPAVPPLFFALRYVQVAAGWKFTIALRANGSVTAVGDNLYGQLNVPALPTGVTFTRVAAGTFNAAGLLSNGALVVWGNSGWPLANVPPLPAQTRYTQVSVGISHVLARRSDGQVVAWGDNQSGQCNVPALPMGLSYVEVSAGDYFSVARRSDGAVVCWGSNGSGQCNVPTPPSGVSYVEVAAATGRVVARRSDGLVTHWGSIPPTPAPALAPGLGYLRITASGNNLAGLIGSASSFVTFGAGCAGSMPATRLTPLDTPRVGASLPIALDHLPANLAIVFVGSSRTQGALGTLPIELTGLGMPGCFSRVSSDTYTLVSGVDHRASFTLNIPNSPTFAGHVFHVQALVPDPAAGNALGAVLSDAATGVTG